MAEETVEQTPELTAMAAMVINAAKAKAFSGEVTLSNGIVLRAKSVPPALIRRVVRAVPEPEIPVVWIEAKQREEPNPNDPAYLAAIAKMHEARLLADQKVRLGLGTEVVSVPEGMFRPEDDGWILQLRAVGVEPKLDDPTVRYVEWCELYAMTEYADVANVSTCCYRKGGIFEPEVMAAIASFWGPQTRGADNGVAAPSPVVDGD